MCQKYGWTIEWYQDVGGHKSGRSEKNRPQWLALKARLGDPDVAALVANDLSRLHRKGWRIGDLIEFLTENEVNLVLAAPGRDVDTSTLKGRMFLQFGAIIDEFYAEDISQRAKDSILYRKSLGRSVGIPPFGTTRNSGGFLVPSPEGAWLLPTGRIVAGISDDAPQEGAVWRGYYEAARYMLALYATGTNGLDRIAYILNDEGWAFRDRQGTPRQVSRDDVRRVVANWPEYGGLIKGTRGKDIPAYEEYDVDAIPFREERAVMPIDLLRSVARVRHDRSKRPTNDGVNRDTYPYPLSGITYCAHCEEAAKRENDPRLRTRLTGKGARKTSGDIPRYRHKPGVRCGCKTRSVRREVYEPDFIRLIRLLTVKEKAMSVMTELAIQADNSRYHEDTDVDKQKEEAIAQCKRRIDAAINLYKDLCVEAVDTLSRLWEISDPEDRRGLAHSLFEYLVYDLDTQRITDFRLKPWADKFLTLRVGLYEMEQGGETENPPVQEVGTAVPLRRRVSNFSQWFSAPFAGPRGTQRASAIHGL